VQRWFCCVKSKEMSVRNADVFLQDVLMWACGTVAQVVEMWKER